MTKIRDQLHDEIDRMSEEEMIGLRKYLDTYPDKLGAFLRRAPWDDEPVTEEDIRAVEEAEKWFEENGGRGIPSEQVKRDLGL